MTVTSVASNGASFITHLITNFVESIFSIGKHSVGAVFYVLGGITGFFSSIIYGVFDVTKAFAEGIINNLMLMVLVTAGFFMYTMYLQRQREIQSQPQSAKLQAKTTRFGVPQYNPMKTAHQPTQNYTAPTQQQQPSSVFGGADRRIPVQQQQQHRMPMHTVPAVY
ncbi:hypothetical protein DFH27DRAFT_600291 [Peziza echinospora]|nr:hypothetical protein DFH27DRAFT_600291 [Peziza echinospora]